MSNQQDEPCPICEHSYDNRELVEGGVSVRKNMQKACVRGVSEDMVQVFWHD